MNQTTTGTLPLASQMDDLLVCIHCGFCLTACPTYELLGDERDSPRGRIYLMRAVAEGRLALDDPSFALHIDRCLGCRACEPACPSGVRYGLLLERAREARGDAGGLMDGAVRRSLNLFFGTRWFQNVVWAMLRLLRATRLPLLIARMGRGRPPGRFRFAMAMLAATAPVSRTTISGRSPPTGRAAARAGARRSEREEPFDVAIALLQGCVMAGLYRHVNRATERVARANRAWTVNLPAGLCCGALHAHAGELEKARDLARKMIGAVERIEPDLFITNSAGCGAALKEYGEWLHDDDEYRERAEHVAASVRDISEWLAELPDLGYAPIEARVGHDAPCHQLHAQGIADAPLAVLSRIGGLDVRPLPRSERCCGAAGTYGLTQRQLSDSLLQRKLDEVNEAGVDFVATGNPGCLMQIGAGALLRRHPVRVVHPVELLDAALRR